MRYTRELIGNQVMQAYLRNMIKSGIVPQAQLWLGPRHVGKRTFLSNHLLEAWCERPTKARPACLKCSTCVQLQHDSYAGLQWLDAAELDMPQLRQVLRDAAATHFSARHRAIVLHQADQLTGHLFNALLKLLEEPRGQLTIYVLADELEALPSTVVSRCSLLRFYRVPDAAIAQAFPDVGQWVAAVQGLPGLAKQWKKTGEQITHWQELLRLPPVARLASLDKHTQAADAVVQLNHLELAVHAALANPTTLAASLQAFPWIAQARRSLQTAAQPKLTMTNLLLNIYPVV